MENLEESIHAFSVQLILYATVILTVLTFISLKAKRLSHRVKKLLFFGITAAVLIPTCYMAISTVYLNVISSSGGPVHWHADIEIWACGQEVDLKDPTGFSNKIGTSTLHEHNDKRIHLEGVVVERHHASLGRFFEVIGGEISPNSLKVPTNDGLLTLENGVNCSPSSSLQVFVYQTDEEQYFTQTKLENPGEYIMAPYSAVPQGDCIIIEFGEQKMRTDKLCQSYEVAQQIGKLKGERL